MSLRSFKLGLNNWPNDFDSFRSGILLNMVSVKQGYFITLNSGLSTSLLEGWLGVESLKRHKMNSISTIKKETSVVCERVITEGNVFIPHLRWPASDIFIFGIVWYRHRTSVTLYGGKRYAKRYAKRWNFTVKIKPRPYGMRKVCCEWQQLLLY